MSPTAKNGAHEVNLATLASRAALSLDSMLRGGANTGDAVVSLAYELRLQWKAKPSREAASTSFALIDPAQALFWERALSSASNIRYSKVPQLASDVESSISRLEQATTLTDASEIERLRDLCVSISRTVQQELDVTLESGIVGFR